MHDDDPVNFMEGAEFEACDECEGKGGYLVCHNCQRAANKEAKVL